jgi:hypothetical protein
MTIVASGKSQITANLSSIDDGDSIASYIVGSGGAVVDTTTSGGNDYLNVYPVSTYPEDSAHTSGDLGNFILAVRNDGGTALAGADGDYIPLTTDSAGKLWTAASLPSTQDFTKAEDSAVSNAQVLAMIGVVRKDAAGTQVSADGDAAWAQQNAVGELRVINKAETSILQQIVTVGTTAVALPTTALTNRKSMMVQMLSGGQLYVGSATVTNTGATRGIRLGQGGFVNLDVGPTVTVYGIADAAGKDVAVLELS